MLTELFVKEISEGEEAINPSPAVVFVQVGPLTINEVAVSTFAGLVTLTFQKFVEA